MKTSTLIQWDLYEIHTEGTPIHGVKLRGRIRLYGIKQSLNVLCDNATDVENCVRFALLAGQDLRPLSDFLSTIVPDLRIEPLLKGVINPVLSKAMVNQEDRYTI